MAGASSRDRGALHAVRRSAAAGAARPTERTRASTEVVPPTGAPSYAEGVTLPFLPSDAAMLLLQAGVVAAPRAVTRPRMLDRFRSRWWALVPVGSIVAVIFAIRYASGTATGLTYLALVAVPPLAAAALAWAARGPRRWSRARPGAAIAATGLLFALAALERDALVGQGAAALLSAL